MTARDAEMLETYMWLVCGALQMVFWLWDRHAVSPRVVCASPFCLLAILRTSGTLAPPLSVAPTTAVKAPICMFVMQVLLGLWLALAAGMLLLGYTH